MGDVAGGFAEGDGALQQREGKLLEEILHLLVPKLVGTVGAGVEHGGEHAVGAVLLAVDKGHKGFEGFRVVLVDDRIEPRADIQCRVGRIAQGKQPDHAQ